MDQRTRALKHANEIRATRARFKAQMKRTAPAEALMIAARKTLDPAPSFHSMRAEEFLKAVPRVGKFHSRKLLVEAGAVGRRLGGLTPRQREQLAAALVRMRRRRYPTKSEEATR